MVSHARIIWFAAGLASGWGFIGTVANSQTTLPTIVVDTPSPVVRSKRVVRPSSRRAQRDGQAASPAASAAPSQVDSMDAVLAPDEDLTGPFIFVDGNYVPVTVVTQQEAIAKGAPTVTDSIAQQPGISGSTFSAGANRPIIRGLDNYRVRIQENGIGSHDVSAISEDHAVPVDPNAVGKIEVVRGPATLRFGSQAIGGVVAVENNRIPTFVPRNGLLASLQGGLSTVDEGRDGAFSVTTGGRGLVFHADASRRRSEDYDTPNGQQFNTFVETDSAAFGSSYIWNNGYVGLALSRFDSFYGIPGRGEEFLEHRPRINLRQDKVLSRGEWRIGSYGIEAVRYWFGASDYGHDEVIVDHELERDVVGTRFTNREVEARVELQHLPFMTSVGRWTGAFGLQTGRQKVHGFAVAEEGDGLLDPSRTRSLAAFAFEELQLSEKLRLQFSGRVEQTDVNGNGVIFNDADPATSGLFSGERRFAPLSASAGVLYDLPFDMVASFTGKYVERAPHAAELFSKGVHEATATFEVGNPNLEVEKAQGIEIGLRRSKGPLRFDATAYYTMFSGFIFKQLDPGRCGENLASCGDPMEDELGLVLFRQRDANFFGTEIAVQFDVGRIWNGLWGIYGQYDFVRAQFANGDNVPRIPPHRLGGGLYYKSGGVYARAGVLQAFEQDKIGFEEVVTPGYTLVSAELSYTSRLPEVAAGSKFEPTFTIGIRGDNLANDEILNHVSFKRRDEILLPGATVRLFGRLQWQ